MEEMGEEMGEEAGSPLCAHAVCVINESEICLESRRDFDAVAGHFSNEAALFQRGGTFQKRRHFSKRRSVGKPTREARGGMRRRMKGRKVVYGIGQWVPCRTKLGTGCIRAPSPPCAFMVLHPSAPNSAFFFSTQFW